MNSPYGVMAAVLDCCYIAIYTNMAMCEMDI